VSFITLKNKVLRTIPGNYCRSQPAGDGLECAAFIQFTRVIVNDHRWQASSYKGPRLSRTPALSLTTIAGKPAPTKDRAHAETVGASLLAMDSSAPRSSS